jgi:transmembrane sensor
MLKEGREQEKSHARCLVEAAAWRVHLTETDGANAPAFDAWFTSDARHRAAWDQVQGPWRLIDDAQGSPALLELRRQVLSRTHARYCEPRQRWRAWFSGLKPSLRAAIGIACVVVLAATSVLWWNPADVYETGPGERLSIALADGSRVELDSSTQLSVQYSSGARALSLARGQARFLVAHDAARPFSVTAGSRNVVATGTDFDIDLLGTTLYVSLLEGRVLVLPRNESGAQGAPTKLEPGEQLKVSGAGEISIGPVSRDGVIAWQSRQIIFDDEPLASAVERINRYSTDRLVLADQRVGALRISGVFRAGNVAGFVDTLTRYLPVSSERRQNTILLRARESHAVPPAEIQVQRDALKVEPQARHLHPAPLHPTPR